MRRVAFIILALAIVAILTCYIYISRFAYTSISRMPIATRHNIENCEYECKYIIPIDRIRVVIVPDNAIIEYADEQSEIVIIAYKVMHFSGHLPYDSSLPKRLDRAAVANNMGIATYEDEQELLISTYGEWHFTGHGSACIKTKFIIPRYIIVKTASKHYGEDAISMCSDGSKDNEFVSHTSYWFGNKHLASKWKKLNELR